MPEIQRPPLAERIRNITSTRVAALMLAAASVATLTGCEAEEPHYDFTACVQPSSADFAAVDHLLAAHAEQSPRQGRAARAKVIQKYHLSVNHLGEPATKALNSAIAGDGPIFAMPFQNYFDAARTAARADGIELDMPTDSLFDVSNQVLKVSEPLKAESLENNDAKHSLVLFLQMLSSQPKELIQWTGIRRVRLVDLPPHIGGAVDTVNNPDTYYVDPTSDPNQDSFRHELWHIIDSKLCKSVSTDPAYTLLNPTSFAYKDTNMAALPARFTTFEDVRPLQNELYSAEALQDAHATQEITTKLAKLGGGVVTINRYGATSVQEDKATVGAELLSIGADNDYEAINNTRYPVLREKIRLQLARLHAKRPDLCDYLLTSINGTPY